MPDPELEPRDEDPQKAAPEAVRESAGAAPGKEAGGSRPEWKSRVRKAAKGATYEEGRKALSPRTTPLSPRNAPPHGRTPEQPGFLQKAMGGLVRGAVSVATLPARLVGRGLDALADWRYRSGRRERDAFVKQGPKGPKAVRPPTGVGGFQVSYDPTSGLEAIRIGGGVTFQDGMKLQGGRAVALHEKAQVHARVINGQPAADRAAMVAGWQWTPAQKADWLKKLEGAVEGFWSRRFRFHSEEPYWQDLGATAVVDVDMKDGPKGPEDTLSLSTIKVPDDVSLGVGVVQSGGRGAKDNSMKLASSDVTGRQDNFLQSGLEFQPGSARLEPEYARKLKQLAIRFKAGTKDPPMVTFDVEGEGRTKPERDALIDQRIATITAVMTGQRFDEGRLMFVYGRTGTSASMSVGNGRAQTVAIHEFGHALGLKDEYATDEGGGIKGTGKAAGRASGHDALAKKVGLPGSVHENNDGLMSLGSAMRPSYGATFLWALRDVTGRSTWEDGPPRKVEPPKAGEAMR